MWKQSIALVLMLSFVSACVSSSNNITTIDNVVWCQQHPARHYTDDELDHMSHENLVAAATEKDLRAKRC